jgi:hypothetical protein
MTKTNQWALVSELYEIDVNTYEAKLVFADPSWTPDSLSETVAYVEIEPGEMDGIVVRDAAPAFGSYDESDEQRVQRLRRVIFDVTFYARFYLFESANPLPNTPFPIAFGRGIRLNSFALDGIKLSSPLNEFEPCVEGIHRIASNAKQSGKEISASLQSIAAKSSLSHADVLPVSWGRNKSFKGVLVNSESPSIFYSQDSTPPEVDVYVLESEVMIR